MLTVCVQAGGRSSRMGVDKGLIQLGGKPLIEFVLESLQGLGEELMLTTNRPEAYAYLDLKMASDVVPGRGALYGLSTALEAAEGDRVLVIACDMPFLNRAVLEYMLKQGTEKDVVVPKWRGRFEPMHAIYARNCLPKIQESTAFRNARITDFYPKVQVHEISPDEIRRFDPEGLCFFNINTPEDIREAELILKQQE